MAPRCYNCSTGQGGPGSRAKGDALTLAEALSVAPGDVVALVGGGGKTTLMYRLAEELAAAGRRVLVTTTTKIYPPLPDQVDWAIADEDDDRRLAHVAGMLRRHAIVAALSGPGPEGKMNGVSPAWVERAATEAGADCILVEADGAARRPIKAPAPHEPVIPTCATVVVAVIGLDALGTPLDVDHVHRPDRIAALTGLVPGEPLTAEAIALMATHTEGLAKSVPPGARLEYLVNKVDDPQDVARGRVLALALCRAGAPRVVLARAEHAAPVQEVFGAEQAQAAV